MKQKIKSEVERFKKFQRVVLGIKEGVEVADIDIRNYAKFILRDGTNIERRELLSNIKNQIQLSNKNVVLGRESSSQKPSQSKTSNSSHEN